MNALLGIDFGGTSVKLGLVTREGTLPARTAVPVDSARRFDEMATAVCEAGTRIGGGVVIERRVVTGADGMPPEIGALCLNPDGPGNYGGIWAPWRLASAAAFAER